jgi:hypothetical protein
MLGLLGNLLVAEDDMYAKDGTVDYRGNHADKSKTGTWKACPYILGTYLCNPSPNTIWKCLGGIEAHI